MNILLISGGLSSEREISLLSGKQVQNALTKNGHKVTFYDLKNGYTDLKKLAKKSDLLFPVLHGEEGEGGKLHKVLSSLNKPFIGGNWKSFKKGWYKISFKEFCDQDKISTASWIIVRTTKDVMNFGFPSVLKSSNGGSSKEVIILKSKEDLSDKSFKELMNSGDQLLVERFIDGVELTVAILGDQALPVLEIIPPAGKWFDYKNKYSGETQEIPNAPSLTKIQRKLVEDTALMIHKKLDMGDYSRIDFIFSKNIPYVLEINTIPGLTPTSLFPKAAKAANISFPKLIEKLLALAVKRFKEKE